MLKYLQTVLERFVIPWYRKTQKKTDQLWFQLVKFCMWQRLGMHVHRLAQVWNAIVTTNYDVIQVDIITTSCEYRYRYRYGRSDSWSYCVSAE